MVGAAAAADDPHLWHLFHRLAISLPQIDRIAGVQRLALVKLRMLIREALARRPWMRFVQPAP
jgi:hypothetical protein